MRSMSFLAATVRLAVILVVVGCGESERGDGAPLAGGDTTVSDRTSNAYAFPAPNLTEADRNIHFEGDVAFEAVFVSPPADVNSGLGPLFNNNACAKCHVRDGRGLPVAGQGPLGSPLLVRVSTTTGSEGAPGGPIPVPGLGGQLQDHAIHGHAPEVTVGIEWVERFDEYGDGTPYALRHPILSIVLADGQPLPEGLMTSARIPPPVFGLGLLEAVPEADILGLADPEDRNGDGISGRANRVWDVRRSIATLGRFGWKANTPNIPQQAAAAYVNDMGVTSPIFPEADGSAEIDDRTLEAVVVYTQTLAVPGRDRWNNPEVRRGEALFRRVGCAACHVEALRTGDHAIGALVNQTIHPYTDLLLHDMGSELADGRPDFLASGTEWRTPPLWGLGLAQTVLPYSSFLHDGRARSIEEAILWHGGEAREAKDTFLGLPADDRDDLLAFLRSL